MKYFSEVKLVNVIVIGRLCLGIKSAKVSYSLVYTLKLQQSRSCIGEIRKGEKTRNFKLKKSNLP